MENNHQLSISDLAMIKNIIDLACTRGAFRGNEMKIVGNTYEKLNAFLDGVIAQAEAQREQEASQGESND